MEKITIIPGQYQEALTQFLQHQNIKVTSRGQNLELWGEKDTVAHLLGAFLEKHCLLSEAEKVLAHFEGSFKTQAAERAVACTHKETGKELLNYFTQQNYLHLEGFIRFRLKFQKEEVRYLAHLCAKEILQEEKYREFLMLLQTYVKECEPLVDTVLLMADGAGAHHLYTETGVEITYDYADLEDAEALENEDDVILSSLLTIAPRTVYLYGKDRSANPCLVDTIRKIFSVREIC